MTYPSLAWAVREIETWKRARKHGRNVMHANSRRNGSKELQKENEVSGKKGSTEGIW